MFSPWLIPPLILADALLGDPPSWPHLVRLMGRAIEVLEGMLRRWFTTPSGLVLAGGLLWLLVVGGTLWAGGLVLAGAGWLWPPLAGLIGLVMAFQCLAAGQLCREARRVVQVLEAGDLAGARARLGMIVGRQTEGLSPAAVRRALVETVAENLSDGVVAPLFYLALFGPLGALAYKAVNTLDSMVGYRNQRYRHLGRVPARLDDVANWLPARITALLTIPAAALCGLDAAGARRVLAADHAAHKSPNAGWPEAAYAGALGLKLGGPNLYHGQLVEKPWINPAGRDPEPGDVALALGLMWWVTALAGMFCLVLALVLA